MFQYDYIAKKFPREVSKRQQEDAKVTVEVNNSRKLINRRTRRSEMSE